MPLFLPNTETLKWNQNWGKMWAQSWQDCFVFAYCNYSPRGLWGTLCGESLLSTPLTKQNDTQQQAITGQGANTITCQLPLWLTRDTCGWARYSSNHILLPLDWPRFTFHRSGQSKLQKLYELCSRDFVNQTCTLLKCVSVRGTSLAGR